MTTEEITIPVPATLVKIVRTPKAARNKVTSMKHNREQKKAWKEYETSRSLTA